MSNLYLFEQDIKDINSLPDDESHGEDGFPIGLSAEDKEFFQHMIDENS